MTILKPAFIYFAIVFAAGFLLGIIRVLWLVPAIGERFAELAETPFMLAVVFLAARFTVSKWGRSAGAALGIGVLALLILVLAEITVVLALRGQSLSENIAERDPISGTFYALSLLIFGLMPFLLFRFRRNS